MSSITKYLKQTTKWEKHLDKLDIYGEPSYAPPKELRCRKESLVKEIITQTGAILQTSISYTLDCSIKPSSGDLLDSKPIIAISDYIDGRGINLGFKVLV